MPGRVFIYLLYFLQGYDSIVARGTVEPDPSQDVELTIDGKKVTVPQGKAKPMPQYKQSSFYNSEYLVRVGC